jgi:hypothetical protein
VPQVRGRKARGLQLRRDPDTDRQIEWQTHTCGHCNSVLDVLDGLSKDDVARFGLTPGVGGYCEQCDSAVCHKCAAKQTCFPFAARIERALQNQARRQAMGL